MLTIATINPRQAEEYYQQENYYSKNAALENSEWWGRGAETLGLSGAIADNEVYKNLVNGLSPDGKQALRGKPKGFSQEQTQAKSQSKQSKKQNKQRKNKKQKKQSEERAGVDLTFSAPKSVSLACLVGGDKRLESAHRQAVKRTLEFIEKHYPQTRIKKQRVKTDNLMVAMWHHDTSRELDPHLHTHCILMNFTQLDNGRWQSRTDENLYYNKMLLGQIYRQELALECRKLGYEIEPQPKELFEIKGYTREQIEAFSKRHEQIVKYLEGREIDVTTESKVWAWRRTRVKKNHEMGRNEKLPYWHEEADLYGIVHPTPTPVQEAQTVTATVSQVVPDIGLEKELTTVVSTAIEHCSERKVAFKSEEILEFATAKVKPFGIDKLEQAIAEHPELIKTFDGRYTTQSALARELATIKLMQQGKGQFRPIADSAFVESCLEGKKLTSGQREAIALTATTADAFIAWQGVAGAGKTYALNELKQITQVLKGVASGHEIKLLAGFAPSAAATKVLGKELGIEANTVASLLVSKEPEEIQSKQLWIVDEAGMLSAKDGYALLQRATAQRARVILVGDTRQLSAVEAGNPFKSLQQAGIQTAHLNESLRQKVPDLKKAADLAAAGCHVQALHHLKSVGRIQEISDTVDRAFTIAQNYLHLTPDERQSTLVIAGTHKEKARVMQEIRQGLKQEKTLALDDIHLTRLKEKDLTTVQSRYLHYYDKGDVVVPVREYKRTGLHKNKPYFVEGFQADKLVLKDLSNNQIVVDPMKFRKSVYTQQKIAVSVGERLLWTKGDKQIGRSNRDEFVVTAIEGRTATIRYKEDAREEFLYLDQPLPLDYAIVSTTYSSQAKTADRVLISSTKDRTVSQESVYVAISRVKHDLQIFAEDQEFLFEQAQESNAQETVLELLQHQSKQQTPQQPAPDVNQAVESSVVTPVKPKAKREFPSPIQSVEIRSSKPVASPVKRSNQKPNEVKVPNLPVRLTHPHRPIQKPVEPFWIPTKAGDTPPHIEEKQWCELVEGSAIHPAIATRNFRSLQMGSIEQEHEAWEYLMYSDKLERTNTGRLSSGMLNKYTHIEAGGWWCGAGVDSRSFTDLQPGQKPSEQIWGCYKPNEPRENVDKPGKKIKYEHPPKADLGIFLLDVPDEIADRIYDKAGVNPSECDRASGFWYCVWKHNLPITITEGAKKAASLLSQGHAAIGLPGIYAGYRSKDEHGNPIKAHLHEELAVFATPERDIRFCFDFETRSETKRNIEIAISRTGSLLKQQESKVSVVSLPGSEKGVDDLIAAHGPLAYEQQHAKALPLQKWRAKNKQQQATLEPPKVLNVEERKLWIKAKLTSEQSINEQDKIKPSEKINDYYTQQSKPEWAADRQQDNDERHNTTDQKDFAARGNQHETECENREVVGHQRKTERENSQARSQPDRKSERTEIQLHRLLEAISGYLELEEVEQQLGTFIAEINRSRAGKYVRDQRTEGIARAIERQSSAGIDSAASHGSIEQQGREPERRATRQLLSAITDYLEVIALAESTVNDSLQALITTLSQSQYQDDYGVIQKPLTAIANPPRHSEISQQALAAISEFVEESYIESALPTTLKSVIGQLSSSKERSLSNQPATKNNSSKEQPSIDQTISDQAINAISSYVEQQEVLDSTITQDLATLTEQLGARCVAKSNQQLTSVKTEHLAWTDYEQIIQRAISSIVQYVETQTIEATPLEQNLEAWSDQLLQPSSQEVAKTGQQSSLPLVERQSKVAKTKAIEIQTSQLLEALADYVEVATIDAALAQPLGSLVKELTQHQQGVSKQQINKHCFNAIAQYVEQETIELQILPVLENVVAELNTLRKSKSLPLISVNPNPDISKRAYDSIASFIEEAAVESGITESLEHLAEDLKQIKPQIPTSIKQLDSTVSKLLQQLEAAKARKQQETSAHAVEAIVNYIEQSAVESVLNPQVLQTLTNQFEQLGEPKLTTAMRQLEAIAADYQTRLQAQAVKPIVKAIADYCEQTVINEAIAQDIEYLAQSLSLPSKSQLPKQFQQLSSLIEQYHQQMEAQQTMNPTMIDSAPKQKLTNISRVNQDKLEAFKAIANWLRDMPLEEVAERLGLERDRHDKHKWKGVGQTISINDQKFYDHLALKGGYGAIDLVMHVQGRNFKEAVNWLSNGISALPLPPQRLPQPKVPQERQPFQPPVPDDSKWQEVRHYLVQQRGLPTQLVDDLHSCGKIYAAGLEPDSIEKLRLKGYSQPENITNAVFLRQNLDQEPTGASLRGVSDNSSFKGLATGSHRDNGWFSFTQGEGRLERIVLVESAIDALSAAALAKQKSGKTMFMSTDGTGSVPIKFLQQQSRTGNAVIVAYDADAVGEQMAQKVIEALPSATRVAPSYGKDWNERLIIQHEAIETATAVRQMFNQLLKNMRVKQPDGSVAFEATKWRFTCQGDIVTIAVKQDNREILKVQGDKPITFNPSLEEREKFKDFRYQVKNDLQQQRRQKPDDQQQRQRVPKL